MGVVLNPAVARGATAQPLSRAGSAGLSAVGGAHGGDSGWQSDGIHEEQDDHS